MTSGTNLIHSILGYYGFSVRNNKLSNTASDTYKVMLDHPVHGRCFAKVSSGNTRAPYKSEERIYAQIGDYQGFVPYIGTILLDANGLRHSGEINNVNSNVSSGKNKTNFKTNSNAKARILITKVNPNNVELQLVYPKLTANQQFEVVRQIVRLLRFMEDNCVMHNDLHTSNILYDTKTGEVSIYDWDSASITKTGKKFKRVHNKWDKYPNITNKFYHNSDLMRVIFKLYPSSKAVIKEIIKGVVGVDDILLNLVDDYTHKRIQPVTYNTRLIGYIYNRVTGKPNKNNSAKPNNVRGVVTNNEIYEITRYWPFFIVPFDRIKLFPGFKLSTFEEHFGTKNLGNVKKGNVITKTQIRVNNNTLRAITNSKITTISTPKPPKPKTTKVKRKFIVKTIGTKL